MKKIIICLSVFIFAAQAFICKASAEQAKIAKGKKVKFDYVLKVDEKVIDSSVGKQPFEYIHGEGNIIPGLAAQLEGMRAGDKKTIKVEPKDAYGEIDVEGFKMMPKSNFPKGFEPKVGMIVPLRGPDGKPIPATIWSIDKDRVMLNLNHPLAGKTLEFEVKILEVK